MSISAVLLAYKEEENLRVLIPQIRAQLEKLPEEYTITVVDTAEPLDGTESVCRELGAEYVNQRYPGFGGALRTGIEEVRGDKFLIMDSDGSHSPEYIPELYRAFVSGADIAIGSRYARGGRTHDAPVSVVMSRILNAVFRVVIGVKARDISTDYRIYDTKQLKAVSDLKCRNYDVLQEVLMKMKLNRPGLVIKEIPITFDKRMYGESKRRLLPFIADYIRSVFRLAGMRISGGKGG